MHLYQLVENAVSIFQYNCTFFRQICQKSQALIHVMALSLLQGYSSPSEASESDSDDSDDGIVVTIDRNVLNGGRPGKNRITHIPLH